MKILKVTALALTVGAALGAQAQIINSDFEAAFAGLGPNSYVKVNAGTALAGDFATTFGWTVTGTTGSTGIDLVQDLWPGTPNSQPGKQWVDLAGSPGPGGITRQVNLVAGRNYRLTFDAFRNNASYQINVALGSLFTSSLTSALTNSWKSFDSGVLTATATGLVTLSFATPQGGSGNVGLDNVQLVDLGVQAEPVPEPMTLALGAAGLAAAVRRRRARRA